MGDDPGGYALPMGYLATGKPEVDKAGIEGSTARRSDAELRRMFADAGYKGERLVLLHTTDQPFYHAATLVVAETLRRLEGENRVVFRYVEGTNPNGALNDIAGIVNEAGNVIGMMPHPENMIEPLHGKTDCRPMFESLLAA